MPDIAYLSFDRSRDLTLAERDAPAVPPDLVFEILSPDDRPGDVAMKREQYRSAGVTLVVTVDPATRQVDAYDESGLHSSAIAPVEFRTSLFPDLAIPFAAIFAKIDAR